MHRLRRSEARPNGVGERLGNGNDVRYMGTGRSVPLYRENRYFWPLIPWLESDMIFYRFREIHVHSHLVPTTPMV